MPRSSQELKEQIVKKMTPPNSQTVAEISRETGISQPTRYAWKKQSRSQGYIVPSQPSKPDRWDAKNKNQLGQRHLRGRRWRRFRRGQ